MKKPNLRAFDLNLLPILDALLDERSVSRAGERINLSQSATSSALLRLREYFGDPIVIREGQRMVPSQRTLIIRDMLKEGLATITNVIVELKRRDTELLSHVVSLSAPEHIQLTLAGVLKAIVLERGNEASLRVLTLDQDDALDLLDHAKLDVAIGAFNSLPSTLHRRKLYKESMICVMREDHPIIVERAARLSMADIASYQHLVVSSSDDVGKTHLSKWLISKTIRRKVGLVVQHISVMNEILCATDMICLGTERSLQASLGRGTGLASVALPPELGSAQYLVEMVWHDRTDADEALIAIRDALQTFGRSL